MIIEDFFLSGIFGLSAGILTVDAVDDLKKAVNGHTWKQISLETTKGLLKIILAASVALGDLILRNHITKNMSDLVSSITDTSLVIGFFVGFISPIFFVNADSSKRSLRNNTSTRAIESN